MKKFITLLLLLCISLSCFSGPALVRKQKWYEKNPKVEIVNETTVIFKDVIKIQIKTTEPNQITYVYDLKNSKLVKVARGSFEIGLPIGNYLVQSDKKITKTIYEVVIE
jgi:hypothetical protein